jgi:hypothetical protein
LPAESPEQPPVILWAIQFEAWSLEDLLDDWLEYVGCGPRSAHFREVPPDASFGPLTPDLLDPRCADAVAVVWRYLYRDVFAILHAEEPDESIPSN